MTLVDTLTTTLDTFLMVKEGASGSETFNLVCPIKDYPDILAAPSGVEFTTLSNGARVFRPGLKDTPDNLPFTANYNPKDADRVKSLEGAVKTYSLWFGGTPGATVDDDPTPTGEYGKIDVQGTVSLSIPGKGVNDPREMVVNLMPASDPVLTLE